MFMTPPIYVKQTNSLKPLGKYVTILVELTSMAWICAYLLKTWNCIASLNQLIPLKMQLELEPKLGSGEKVLMTMLVENPYYQKTQKKLTH
jgi:hypothetical protein